MTGASNGLINGGSAPFASTAGVSTLNGLSGALNIVAGANITVTPSGTSITITSTGGGGGGSPGGMQYDVQLNNGAGGFAGSNDLNFQGGYLTINGDSGYGQLQWLNSPLTGGYAGSGISGVDNEIIAGALAGDMTFWSSQAMNFSADTGVTNMLRINTDGTIKFSNTNTPYANLYIDASGNLANGFTLLDSTGVNSIFLDTRILRDSSNVDSAGWNIRILYGPTGANFVDWSGTYNGVLNIGSNYIALNYDIQDNLGFNSIDTNSRIIYASDGSTGLIDYRNTGSPIGNYYFISGVLQGNGSGLSNTVRIGQAIGSGVSGNLVLFADGSGNLAQNGSFSYDPGTITLSSGAFSGSGAALINLSAGNITAGGTLPSLNGSALTNLTSGNLTGALPAIDGSALTVISAPNLAGALPAISGASLTSLTSSVLSGALPAIDGSSLTGLTASQVSGITQTVVNSASGIGGLSGVYTISNTLGGSVTFTNGVATNWVPAA